MRSGIRQPSVEELDLINKNYSKRELKADEIYVFDVDAANNDTVTAYFSRLGSDMIDAFHRDVNGRHTNPDSNLIGYLFGHNDQMIPSGTLFKSELVTENVDGKEIKRFKPTVFMPKNLNVGGINTDDYIRAYESGTTEDCSVGFMAAQFICDICNNDIRDFWNCQHIPGRTYVINEQAVQNEGATPITKQCTYTVHQGFFKEHNLLELSGVYRGAMWGSKIVSQDFVVNRDGKIIDKDDQVLASNNIKDFKSNDILRFNYQFDGSIEKVGSIEEEDMDAKQIKEILEKLKLAEGEIKTLKESLESGNSLFEKSKLDLEAELTKSKKLEEDLKATSRVLSLSEADKVDLQEQLEKANQKITELEADNKQKADIVDAYMKSLRDRCRKLSVQINGQNHNEELFEKEISVLSIEELNQKIEILEKQLAQIIPIGRKTEVNDRVHSLNKIQSTTQPNKRVFKIK